MKHTIEELKSYSVGIWKPLPIFQKEKRKGKRKKRLLEQLRSVGKNI
jgi:hypothetical protein